MLAFYICILATFSGLLYFFCKSNAINSHIAASILISFLRFWRGFTKLPSKETIIVIIFWLKEQGRHGYERLIIQLTYMCHIKNGFLAEKICWVFPQFTIKLCFYSCLFGTYINLHTNKLFVKEFKATFLFRRKLPEYGGKFGPEAHLDTAYRILADHARFLT